MAFRKLTSNALQRKESRAWPAILSAAPRGPLWMSANYHAFAYEGYIGNPTVYACINATIRALRGIEWGVYTYKGTEQTWIEDGPLVDLINHPNDRQTFSSIVGEWAGMMEISGNAYIEGVSLDKGQSKITRAPSELFILRSDRMFIQPGTPDIPIAAYEYRAGGYNILYTPQLWKNPASGRSHARLPVMHSKYWHPLDDFYGLSPIQAAAKNVDSTGSAMSWNVALTQNSARPSGIFSTAGDMTVDQMEEYTNALRQKFSGPGNAGRPMVLGNDAKWQPITLTPAEMDWWKSIENDDNCICRIFGIPPEIVGDSGSRTFSNYETAEKAVYNDKWLPTCDIIATDLNLWLAPLFWEAYGKEVYIGYRRDKIEAIQQDQKVVRDAAENLFKSTIIMQNEARRMCGLEPDPNGDVYYVPTTAILVPQSSLGKTANALTQQTINPPKPPPAALPPGKPKPTPKKSDDPELAMMYGEVIGQLKQLT